MSTSDALPRPAPAPQGEGSDDDGIICGSPAATPPVAEGDAVLRKRRRRSVAVEGSFSAWIVGDAGIPDPVGAAAPGRLLGAAAPRVVVGPAQMHWRFVEFDDARSAAHIALQPPRHGRASRAKRPWGYVEYLITKAWPFSAAVNLPDDFDLDTVTAAAEIRHMCMDVALEHSHANMRTLLAGDLRPTVASVMALPRAVALGALAESPEDTLVRSVPLLLRGTGSGLVPLFPKASLVTRWRQDLNVSDRAGVPVMQPAEGDFMADIECELPTREPPTTDDGTVGRPSAAKRPIDPIRLIKGLRFAHLLRDTKCFEEGLDASDAYKAEVAGVAHVRPEGQNNPGTTTLRTAYGKVDTIGMLISRRQLKAERLANKVQAVNLFTDASPVTGEEMQGMVMEVITTDNALRRDILPGATLEYGHYDAISKGVCLLFALFLVAGPFFVTLTGCWRMLYASAPTSATKSRPSKCQTFCGHFWRGRVDDPCCSVGPWSTIPRGSSTVLSASAGGVMHLGIL